MLNSLVFLATVNVKGVPSFNVGKNVRSAIPFRFYAKYTTAKKNPVENKPTQ